MTVDPTNIQSRAYYGARLVRVTLDLAETLAYEANRFLAQLVSNPDRFPGRWDRERIELLAPSIQQLLHLTIEHHNGRQTAKFSADLATIVQKHRVIEPLSGEARAFLGLEERPSLDGTVDSFRRTGQMCAQLQDVLFARMFDEHSEQSSFADFYFGSEFFEILDDYRSPGGR